MAKFVEQNGIQWSEGWMFMDFYWTTEPDTAIIAELAAHHLAAQLHGKNIEVSTLRYDDYFTYNQVYDVRIKGEDSARWVFRVAAPVDPYYKTESEVATMQYVKTHTTIPVPSVVAYNSSAENKLGFEWILMEKMPGVTLQEAWPSMSWAAKKAVTKEVADMVMKLQSRTFESIGSLYSKKKMEDRKVTEIAPESESFFSGLYRWLQGSKEGQYILSRLIHPDFFRGKRVHIDMDRGPWNTCLDFARARINVEIASFEHFKSGERILEELTDIDKVYQERLDENSLNIDTLIDQVKGLHAKDIFGTFADEGESGAKPANDFVLQHTDLSDTNILVDPTTYKITAILDWEFAAIQPRWQASTYPSYLWFKFPIEIQDLHNIADYDSEFYYERLDWYERHKLRKYYNSLFKTAGVPSPESFARDKPTRQKREFLHCLAKCEQSLASQVRDFVEYLEDEEDEEYWVIFVNHFYPWHVFVPSWPEEYVLSKSQERTDEILRRIPADMELLEGEQERSNQAARDTVLDQNAWEVRRSRRDSTAEA